jgi:hypothetical protein
MKFAHAFVVVMPPVALTRGPTDGRCVGGVPTTATHACEGCKAEVARPPRERNLHFGSVSFTSHSIG